ncbi:site-specific integrase [Capillimicrobium parvum]
MNRLDQRRGSLLVRRRKVGVGAKWAWTTGPGNNSSHGSPRAWTYRSGRCCASPPGRRGDANGQPAPHAPSCATPPRAPVSASASPHQLRHAHAVEMGREGVPLIVIQRQLGHTNLGITSIYLQGIDSTEIFDTVHARRAAMIPVEATLGL